MRDITLKRGKQGQYVVCAISRFHFSGFSGLLSCRGLCFDVCVCCKLNANVYVLAVIVETVVFAGIALQLVVNNLMGVLVGLQDSPKCFCIVRLPFAAVLRESYMNHTQRELNICRL